MARGRKKKTQEPSAVADSPQSALAAAVIEYLDTFRAGFAWETLDLHLPGDEYPEDREFVRVSASQVKDGKCQLIIELLQSDGMDDAWLLDAMRDLHTAVMLAADDDDEREQDAGALREHVNARLKNGRLLSLISHSEAADFANGDDPPERLRFTAVLQA